MTISINDKMRKFYSIIVPAKNEKKYLARTMGHFLSLNYPKNKYEIIIVESGSNDGTYELAKKFKSGSVKIYHLDALGVSRARNFGASKTSKKSNWLVFTDADTILKKEFLKELDSYIEIHKEENLAIGAPRIAPIEKSRKAAFILRVYSAFLKIIHASYAIQIIKKDFFNKVKYDEHLKVGEDYQIIRGLTKFGNYFYLQTNQVETSIRRFKKIGYARLFFIWCCGAVLPSRLKRKIDYPEAR